MIYFYFLQYDLGPEPGSAFEIRVRFRIQQLEKTNTDPESGWISIQSWMLPQTKQEYIHIKTKLLQHRFLVSNYYFLKLSFKINLEACLSDNNIHKIHYLISWSTGRDLINLEYMNPHRASGYAVLRTRIRILPSRIPDPGLKRIRIPDPDPHQRIQVVLVTQKLFLSSRKYGSGCSSRIPDPDPESRGQNGIGSRIRNTADPY
jgi:hypothetical protein